MKINPITQIDFYKSAHKIQYPEGTELVYSNLTARSTHHLAKIAGTDDKIVFFGLQFFIKDYLIDLFNRQFFQQPKDEVVTLYKRRMDTSLGVDAVNVDHIGELHDLGYLPISIRALPEGSVIDTKIPFLTIENTLPKFFWLTNYLETIISNYIWKPTTSATIARKYKQLLTNYAVLTGVPLEFVNFQGHDFSFRGMSGIQDAVTSGAGHLLSFVGTDTVPAIDFLENYYNADSTKELVGCSVPASEHSCMCLGMKDDEFKTFERLITKVHPKGIVSIVSDTWDFWQVVNPNGGILARLKDVILIREGKVVIRPDSGDPVKIIVGDSEAPEGSLENKGLIQCLWEIFGGTENIIYGSHRNAYFKVLDSHIGAIYGDSITLQRADEILKGLQTKGFAANNIVFGIGSFTYEYQTRDTLGTAMKATAGIVNGEFREIFKDPKTDNGMKKSAKGYLHVVEENGNYKLIDQVDLKTKNSGALKEVFRDGKLLIDQTLQEIRTRLDASIKK